MTYIAVKGRCPHCGRDEPEFIPTTVPIRTSFATKKINCAGPSDPEIYEWIAAQSNLKEIKSIRACAPEYTSSGRWYVIYYEYYI